MFDDERERTSGFESDPSRQAATDPRHAAELVRRELVQLDAGDVAGAVSILTELLDALNE